MIINRDNYEEFFLLFVDNELPETEKQAVERFVQQNPDLAEELNMLMQSRLTADEEIHFEKKEVLHQPEKADTSLIRGENYTVYLLSYVDNELNIEEKNALEEFLFRHPRARQELEILQMTKLKADKYVVFPDKYLLYKTTRKPAKLVTISWWRIAAAATVILVASLLWMTLMRDKTQVSKPELAQDSIPDKKENISPSTVTKNETARIENNTNDKIIEENAPGNNDTSVQTSSPQLIASSDNSKRKKESREQMISADKTGVMKNEEDTKVIARVETNVLTTEEIYQNPVADNTIVVSNANLPSAPDIVGRPALSADVKTDYASDALLNQDYGIEVIPMAESQSKKGLFRGLVRKANRVFNKVTNPEPGKPMVRVANFEIALAK